MLALSSYAQNLLRSTCCHSVALEKDGVLYTGVYNGLSYWGRVEDENGKLVEELSSDFDEEENQHYNFVVSDFLQAGYLLA